MSRWFTSEVSLHFPQIEVLCNNKYILAAMLFFGWLGFNGGSAFGANIRGIVAIWNTMIAAGLAGIVWCALDYRYERRFSMVGFCSGTIGGLVAATPSSGYIHPWGSVVTGILAGALCNFATKSTPHPLDLYQ